MNTTALVEHYFTAWSRSTLPEILTTLSSCLTPQSTHSDPITDTSCGALQLAQAIVRFQRALPGATIVPSGFVTTQDTSGCFSWQLRLQAPLEYRRVNYSVVNDATTFVQFTPDGTRILNTVTFLRPRPGVTAPTAPPAAARGIFIVKIEPGTGKIAGGPTPLTAREPAANCAPAWSPDGRAIAFKRWRAEATEKYRAVYDWMVHDLQSGAETVCRAGVTDCGGWSGPLWYPDSRHVLAKSFFEWNDPKKNCRISLDDGKTTELVMPECKPAVAISRDGRTLYTTIQDTVAKTTGIVAIDSETGARTLCWKSPLPDFHSVPLRLALSPDGRTFAVVLDDGTETYLVRVNTDGTDYRLLYTARGTAAGGSGLSRSGLAWCDQGRSLLFMDGDGQGQRLLRISADGGWPEFTGLMMGGADIIFDLSPDGTQLALSPGAPRIVSTH